MPEIPEPSKKSYDQKKWQLWNSVLDEEGLLGYILLNLHTCEYVPRNPDS